MDTKTILTFAVMLAAMVLLTYIHEFLHALFYPEKAMKTIWKSSKQGAYLYAAQSAPWYTSVFVYGIVLLILLGMAVIAKLLIRKNL